jgi:HIP---CoA ligase
VKDPGTIPGVIFNRAREQPSHIAIHDGDTTLTYRELMDRSLRVAAGLIRIGVSPTDRVAIWAPNSWQWIVAALGVQITGAAIVPLNTRFRGEEAADVIERSRARVLVTVGTFLGVNYLQMLAPHTNRFSHLAATVVLGENQGIDGPSTVSLEELMDVDDSDVAVADSLLAALSSDAVADVLYTSGTTGYPKGVALTHGQTVRGYLDYGARLGLRAGDHFLVVSPFFHSFGYKAGWVVGLMCGVTIYPVAVFDARRALTLVAQHGITILPGPPTVFFSLLAVPREHRGDLSSLRVALTGAASIPVQLIQAIRAELGFEHVFTAYGLTETSALVTMTEQDDPPEVVANTVGRPLPDVTVQIRGPAGQPVSVGETGEIVVRGYNVMSGYFENPRDTAEVLDRDGWLRTGDAGRFDENGNLVITDRIKDIYVTGGFNCYPAEIENMLMRNPAVSQVGVVGIADERLGEVGAAFVVVSRPTTEAELIAWARECMANFKVPRKFWIVDSLPVTANGKVQRARLRDRAEQRLHR